MIPDLVYYQLVILVLLWLCVMLPHFWPTPSRGMPKRAVAPSTPKRKRSNEPKVFEGLTQKPHCALCEQKTTETPPLSPGRPAPTPPPTAALVPWIRPYTSVPIWAVTIAAGWS
jgi:hypothetical protein